MTTLLRFVVLSVAIGTVSAQEIRRAEPVNPPVGQAASVNALARFLGGLPVEPGSPLAPLQVTPAYQAHAMEMARMWSRFHGGFFQPKRAWSALELAPRVASRAPVMYFFGGPDVASVVALFPDASDYLLGGLEPVGMAPAPDTLDPVALDHGLTALRDALDVVLAYGHFITSEMKSDLSRAAFRGVLPIALAFLARAGCDIVSVDYIGIGANGAMAVSGTKPAGSGLPGVRIVFRAMPEAGTQTLYYVAADISNAGLARTGGVLRWTESFGESNAYFKAASYLMHESSFSQIRSFVLANAASILQDDSGIPFRFLRDGGWKIFFFGVYSGTLDIFTKYKQDDLGAAFAGPGMAVPLPFGTGYKWRRGESNLILALRPGTPPRALPGDIVP